MNSISIFLLREKKIAYLFVQIVLFLDSYQIPKELIFIKLFTLVIVRGYYVLFKDCSSKFCSRRCTNIVLCLLQKLLKQSLFTSLYFSEFRLLELYVDCPMFVLFVSCVYQFGEPLALLWEIWTHLDQSFQSVYLTVGQLTHTIKSSWNQK